MPSVVFSSSSISPTNSYRKRGNTVTASFYQSSGSLPGAGSSIQSVVVSFSDVTVYSQTTAGFSTNYFEVSLDLDSAGSQTQVAYSVSSALLNFTGGSITFTVGRRQQHEQRPKRPHWLYNHHHRQLLRRFQVYRLPQRVLHRAGQRNRTDSERL